ncbi:MAG: hypothetical protein A3J75_00795 [Acidobacteria bacterium RBG_16_68_9]|nr:MAG: hypothetical protein A3J75_00795 [Acidobacteria bacterium RBG_16_68_9]
MDTSESRAKRIFTERAALYVTSDTHADPRVLARVVDLSAPEPDWAALDIATGTGHTAVALAPHVRVVIGTDLTPEMLRQAARLRAERSLVSVSFAVADSHHLPFPGDAFALVTCRRPAHHFSDIARALSEMRRVLRPHGRLVIDDRSVAEDDFIDACMNQLDRHHDESHVREYRPSEWKEMLAACGFLVEVVEPYRQHRPLTALTAGVSPENVARIHALLAALDANQRAALNLRDVDGAPHLDHWYVLISARCCP